MYARKMNFLINLTELKFRSIYFLLSLIFTFLICFYFRVELFFLISSFFLRYEQGFIYTNLLEPIIIYLKLSLMFSLFFLIPYYIYIFGFFFFKSFFNFYTFFYFLYFLLTYFILILFFIFFIIYFFPILFKFLLTFQRIDLLQILELELQATMDQYYHFFVNFSLFYLIINAIPNILLLLIFNNVVNKSFFINYKFRKYLYLFTLIIFFIFSPPDFFVQILILPFIFLSLEFFIYIISFFFCLYYTE